MKGKVIRSFVVLTCTLLAHSICAEPEASPQQNRFDLLAKALSPFIALATPNGNDGNHALDLQVSILETSGLPPELKGKRLHISFEAPDKVLAQIPTPSGIVTIGRHDDKVWAFPGKQLQPLLDRLPAEAAKKKKQRMKLSGLHFSQAEAILLPALLTVRAAGSVTVGGSTFRVLDVGLMPELKLKEWSARVWIRPENESIAQIAVHSPSGSATLLIEKTDFAVSFPLETWEPTADQRAEMVEIPMKALMPLLERLWRVAPATPSPASN
ncbi:MAG: hypothetical protein ABJB22_05785 [Verrucomicrobiota bacterium]